MINEKATPLVIFGNGAMARESETIIKRINAFNAVPVYNLLGFVTDSGGEAGAICADTDFSRFAKDFNLLAVVIPMSDGKIRKKIYESIKDIKNITFPNLIDPYSEWIDNESVKIGIGNIIEYGAVMNINSVAGNFNLINIRCIVGHDCRIGNYCTIGPGAILSGNVRLGDNTLIGAGTAIKQNLEIGENAVLGLGAFTVKDIAPNQVMVCEQAVPLNISMKRG